MIKKLTVYLDIIFLENMLMNYIILFATLIIIKAKCKHQQIKLILSSAIGSIYSIIVYLNILEIYSNILSKIVLSIVMTYVAFEPKNGKQMLKQLLIFYLVSFIFGGCTFALIYFIKPENIVINNGVFVGTYPIKVTLIAGTLAFIITQVAFKINKSKISSKNSLFNIEIFFEGKVLKVKALLDSGNMLKDPISKLPVVIVEKEELKNIITEEFFDYMDNIWGGDSKKEYEKNVIEEYLPKVRMVPFMSIGKENGMLTGIRVDKIKVRTEDIEVNRDNVIIGIYDKTLTKDNKYNALIGLNLLEGEDANELTANTKK